MDSSPRAAARRVHPALLRRISGSERMFTLGGAITRVIGMGYSDDQGTADLAYYVVSDIALTQRILRLSNAVHFRTRSNTQVTTISRAISLLGFDDSDWAPVVEPPLSVIEQPAYDIGLRAAELLVARIEGGGDVRERIQLPTRYLARGSVAAPPFPGKSS